MKTKEIRIDSRYTRDVVSQALPQILANEKTGMARLAEEKTAAKKRPDRE